MSVFSYIDIIFFPCFKIFNLNYIACNIIVCSIGKAVVTESFDLTNCKYIIHAVGPIYVNGKHEEEFGSW
jgi:O-acetyl-ADP-ribose deacetylase (regulator of RNase III)